MAAHLERAVRDRAEADAPQPHHRVSDRVAHVAHLARASLVQRDREQRLVLAGAEPGVEQPHGRRRGAPAPDRDAPAQPVQLALLRHAAHARVVLALHLVLRMQQPLRELAVVREQQEPLGVVVQPADGVDVLAHLGQQIEDRRPVLGVLPRRHVAAGLVEQDVAVAPRHADALAVDADVVAERVGPRAQLEHGGAVHRHAAAGDEGLRRAPRRDSGGGEDLLQAIAGGWWIHVADLTA